VRQIEKKQAPLTTAAIHHQHTRELDAISEILDAHPELARRAQRDLSRGRRTDVGREGMSGEQAIRIALLKQIHQVSYRELAFQLADSATFRRFARLPFGRTIKVSALQANVKSLSVGTWELINKALLRHAEDAGIEDGRKIRTDCTVVESNIHEPSDSSLLWDCVRVIMRLVKRAQAELPELDWSFVRDHRRAAKQRALEIKFPPRSKKDKAANRKRAYRKLIRAADACREFGLVAEARLRIAPGRDFIVQVQLNAIADELAGHLASLRQVLDQTTRRVIEGESVPAREKIVSIFEKHTDIIIKDHYETLFGHKICLTGGASSMILDVVVEDGNPADSSLVERSIERQRELYGRSPRQASFDGGFASKENLKTAKRLGVKDVAFHKKCGLKISEMVKSAWVFKRLRNFRAGIEGCISALKRAFGLERCTWRGRAGFDSYVWSCVVAFNAIVLARHLTA